MSSLAPTRRQMLTAGLSTVFVSASLAACSGGDSGSSDAASTALVTAWPTDVTTLDPATASSAQDWEMCLNVYQGLLMPSWTETENGAKVWSGLELSPSLAESYETNADTATLHLRQDVTFHPSGNPLTAEDVLWSFSRHFTLGRTGDLNNGGLYSVDQFVAVDDHTVKVNFIDRDGNAIPATPTLMQTFRMPNYGVLDSVAAKEHATTDDPTATEWLKNNVVGTGPYYLKSRTAGQEIALEAVPGGLVEPGFAAVTIRVINSGNVAALLKGGQINLGVYGLTEKDLNDLESTDLTVDHESTPEFAYLQMATEAGPLADPLVRQAMAYAIPYDQIISSVYFDRAQRALSYVNVAAPGYTEAFAKYTTDIDTAKNLMAQAGNPEVTVPLHFPNSEPALEDVAIYLKDGFAQIGITLELRPETPAEFSSLITSRATDGVGDPDAILRTWSSWIDDPKTPIGYATTTGGVNNYSMWADPRVDEIAKVNQFAEFTDERAATYEEAQEIVAEAAPLIPIANIGRTVVMAAGITGASFAPEFGLRYWTLEPTA